MTVDDAVQFCKEAWPGEGVTVRTIKGVCEVVGKGGNVMGRAFSWRPALQQAYKPFLAAAQKAAADKWEAQKADREAFVEFLWDKLRPEFEEWKEKRDAGRKLAAVGSGDQGTDAGGAQSGEAQLVQVDAEAERPGTTGAPRLVLP